MSPEERLLTEIFAEENDGDEDKLPDNYPETFLEKAGYAEYCLQKSLEYISPALSRLGRLCQLLTIGESGDKGKLPDVITHCEARVTLEKMLYVKRAITDAFEELGTIYESTKEAMKDVPKNNETE